jgi:hypothetical protein
MNRRTKLLLVGVGALTLATLDGALAFQIDPQCQSLTDNSKVNQISCTCAMQNGGRLLTSRGMVRWIISRGAKSPEFENCLKANGGEE